MSVERELIDDAFYTEEGRFLWNSYDKEGKPLISALTEEACIKMTRFHLKGVQEGWNEKNSRVVNDGVVGGKL